MPMQVTMIQADPAVPTHLQEHTKKELAIAGFEEVETPEADIVSLGSASYTKMLSKTYAS